MNNAIKGCTFWHSPLSLPLQTFTSTLLCAWVFFASLPFITNRQGSNSFNQFTFSFHFLFSASDAHWRQFRLLPDDAVDVRAQHLRRSHRSAALFLLHLRVHRTAKGQKAEQTETCQTAADIGTRRTTAGHRPALIGGHFEFEGTESTSAAHHSTATESGWDSDRPINGPAFASSTLAGHRGGE